MFEPGGVPVVWCPHYEVDIGDHVFPVEKYRLIKERLEASGALPVLICGRPSRPKLRTFSACTPGLTRPRSPRAHLRRMKNASSNSLSRPN